MTTRSRPRPEGPVKREVIVAAFGSAGEKVCVNPCGQILKKVSFDPVGGCQFLVAEKLSAPVSLLPLGVAKPFPVSLSQARTVP
jgi:hypothetical protein